MIYVGVWRRFWAHCIDGLIVLPLLALLAATALPAPDNRLVELLLSIAAQLFAFWFEVMLVARHGGTPGKRLLGLRIVMRDGSPVSLGAAVLRWAVMFMPELAAMITWPVQALGLSDALCCTDLRTGLSPAPPDRWDSWLEAWFWVWLALELLTVLSNHQRRAIHDFIAGTVVVRSSSIPRHGRP